MDNLTDIGSRQIFTEEHDTIREQFRKFWRSIDKERTQKWTDQGFVDKDFWKEVGAQGMIGIETPLEKGGWGGDFIQHVIATEEQAYARVPGNFLLQSDMVLPYVAHNGSDAQVNRYAQAMRDGECIGAIAMTEAHAGSDLQGMKSWARRDGDDWILNGSKVFITNGYIADTVLVCAITDRDVKASQGMSMFLVDTNLPGFQHGKLLKKIGNHASDTAELFFEDIRLPASAVLGEEEGLHQGFKFLMRDIGRERLVISMSSMCVYEMAYQLTLEYVNERHVFGKPLIKKQEIRHTLSEIKSEYAPLRLLTDYGIKSYNDGEMNQLTASICKLQTTEAVVKNVSRLQQLFGGYGFMEEYMISNLFAACRVFPIFGGTSEIMKEIISRTL